MADEITPVEAVRGALFMEMDDCLERMYAHCGKGSGRLVELTDALITAVRAENDTRLTLWKDAVAELRSEVMRMHAEIERLLNTKPPTVEDYGRLL